MKLVFVFDASPLIHLGRAGLGPLLVDLRGEKFTVPAVVEEVVARGKEIGYPDTVATESLVEEGVLRVENPSKDAVDRIVRLYKEVHRGESEVITLAKEMKAIAVVDDPVARTVAKIHRIRVEGTYGLVLRAAANGMISKEEGEGALYELVSSGWRCDARLYGALLKSLADVARRREQ